MPAGQKAADALQSKHFLRQTRAKLLTERLVDRYHVDICDVRGRPRGQDVVCRPHIRSTPQRRVVQKDSPVRRLVDSVQKPASQDLYRARPHNESWCGTVNPVPVALRAIWRSVSELFGVSGSRRARSAGYPARLR